MNEAQVVIAVIAVIAVVVVLVVSQTGPKASDPSVEVVPWRASLVALQSKGFPGADLAAWVAQGEALAKQFDARAAVSRIADRMAGSDQGAFSPDQEQSRRIRAEILAIQSAHATATMIATQAKSPTLSELAGLRTEGVISEDEFRAFSERFTKSSGEKALEIISAIRALHEQFRSGAMTQGNYHASLWTLMDKLDRDLRT
jgi:hypothetical protein